MSYHDIVVIGASAGGVEALRTLVAGLPEDLPAAVLVVLHVPRLSPSALPLILDRYCALPVRHAIDGQLVQRGQIYVAPPDAHMLLIENRIRLSRGPSENGHRPAVDPLFRSAARGYGPRVVGVVLSGSRDDGAAGLALIASLGGITIVQDPQDALHASMPRAALEAVTPHHVLPISLIGEAISKVVGSPVPQARPEPDSEQDGEAAMADLDPYLTTEDLGGNPAGYGCPSCGGSLFEMPGAPLPRYRCRVGHVWSPESLLEEQTIALEGALWMALRALEEKAELSRRLSEASRRSGRERYSQVAQDADAAARLIRRLVGRIGSVGNGEAIRSSE